MLVRIYGFKFKFCRLYEDDVFGILNTRPKITHKVLNVIFKDLYKEDSYFKKIFKQAKFFTIRLRKFLQKIYNKIFYKLKMFNDNFQIFETIKNSLDNFFIVSKKKVLNLIILLDCLKQIRNKNFLLTIKKAKSSYTKKKVVKFRFNYRVDSGKPRREKKKFRLYSRRLLTRHRLRFFASRIPVRQLRSYVKSNRNSKFLGMYFIWKIETRIDTILYRLNLQSNTSFLRQYIKHVGLFVNNIFVNIPSFRLNFKDYLTLINKKQMYRLLLYKFLKKSIFMSIPYYYETNHRIMSILFFIKPFNSMIFFPFETDIELLGGLGERF